MHKQHSTELVAILVPESLVSLSLHNKRLQLRPHGQPDEALQDVTGKSSKKQCSKNTYNE